MSWPRLVETLGTIKVVAGGLTIFATGLGWAATADANTTYLEIATRWRFSVAASA